MISTYTFPDLRVKRLTDTATIPTRGSSGSAGLDLYWDAGSQGLELAEANGWASGWESDSTIHVCRGARVTLHTGVAMAIPRGYYGQIAPRSGLAVKHGLEILAGVIDRDYRGEIKVAVLNSGSSDIQFTHGDRIAQLLILPYMNVSPTEVDELDDTARGTGGFGSTGA